MNVLFVHSADETLLLKNAYGMMDFQSGMQLGISYISSYLKKHGHQTELVLLGRKLKDRNFEILEESLRAFQPKLICFTAVAPEYEFIKTIAAYIKHKYPDIYLLVGGVHVTLNVKETLSENFDAVCVGEGEDPTLELVQQLEKGQEPTNIPNLWIKHGKDMEMNQSRPLADSIDHLPFPDRGLWQRWMDDKTPRGLSILLSRGCPYDCTYCCNRPLKNIQPGKFLRERAPENIVAEIEEIISQFPTAKIFHLESETINVDERWCIAVCGALAELNSRLKTPLTFTANIKIIPRRDYDPIFAAMKKCNFDMVNIGIESGSERVRRAVLKREYTNDDIVNVVKCARKHGLRVCFFNLMGLPTETLEDFKKTVEINRICKPDRHFTSIYVPYPGNELHKLTIKMGLIKEYMYTETHSDRQIALLDLPGFRRAEIQKAYDYFDFYVYSGYEFEDIGLIDLFTKLHKRLKRIPYYYAVSKPIRAIINSYVAPHKTIGNEIPSNKFTSLDV